LFNARVRSSDLTQVMEEGLALAKELQVDDKDIMKWRYNVIVCGAGAEERTSLVRSMSTAVPPTIPSEVWEQNIEAAKAKFAEWSGDHHTADTHRMNVLRLGPLMDEKIVKVRNRIFCTI
jgi:hypothetical protein